MLTLMAHLCLYILPAFCPPTITFSVLIIYSTSKQFDIFLKLAVNDMFSSFPPQV